MRRGNMRVLVHIALFAVLGIALIVTGVIGNSKLAKATDSYSDTARLKVYKDKASGLEPRLSALFEEFEVSKNSIKNKVMNNKRKSVNEALDADIASGLPDEDALLKAIATYTDRAFDVISSDSDEATGTKLKQKVAGAQLQLIQELTAEARASAESITSKDVRGTMNARNTQHYVIIYYGTAILIIGIACLLLAGVLCALWFTKDSEGRARVGQAIEPFDYLLPFLVGVGVFTLYPMIRVLIMSFQENYKLTGNNLGTATGWGLGNYNFILNGMGKTQFMRALRNTALFVLFTVPITAAIAIVVAHLLNRKSKLNSLFQTAYFMPMVTTATAVGLVWRWMFNTQNGLINALINFFTQFFGAPNNINWLQSGAADHAISMAVLIIYGVWSSLPFTIILLLSGLQNIDDSLYTVAKVDGSKPARIFFRITVPLLSPTIGLVLIINSISAFKVYTDVFVLWNGSPQDYQMETVAWYIFNNIQTADGTHSLGIAAAAAMVLFVIIFVFTMLQKFLQRKWVYQ